MARNVDQSNLTGIAAGKAGQIGVWLKERRGAANGVELLEQIQQLAGVGYVCARGP